MRATVLIVVLAAFTGAGAESRVGDNWKLEVGEIDYETVASLHQESRDAIADEYATREVRPVLSFRCIPGSGRDVTVAVDWRRFISSFNTEVGFKVDDKELLLLNWGVDRSNTVTAPRSGGSDPDLLGYLGSGKNLSVEVIPYSESLITVSYDISGIDAALDELRERCGL